MFIYYFLLGVILMATRTSTCTSPEPNYNLSLPYDYGAHLDFSYEYWWYGGRLHTQNNQTFGFLFALTRCSAKCQSLNDSSLVLTVTITFEETQTFLQDTFYYESPNDDAYMNAQPYELRLGPFSIKSLDPTGWSHVRLQGELHGASLDLVLHDQYPNLLFYEELLSGDSGIHFDQNNLLMIGTLRYLGHTFQLQGTGFHDHYWTNISCEAVNDASWMWFVLPLSNGVQLLVTEVTAPHIKPIKQMVFEYPDGSHYQTADFNITTLEWWVSPVTGLRYPIYNLIQGIDFLLEVHTLVSDNEIFFQQKPLIYEGTSEVVGVFQGNRVVGVGTTELKVER